MSVQAISWVLDWSASTGSTRLVAIALAEHSDKDGANAWPSYATLAAKAKVDRRTISRALAELISLGEIEKTGESKQRTGIYRFPMRNDRGESPNRGELPIGASDPLDRGELPPDPSLTVRRKKTVSNETVKERSEQLVEEPHAAIVARFEQAAELKNVVVNPRLVRQALADYASLPDLEQRARDCANWLAENAPANGNKPRHASATLRTWLRKEAATLPTRGAPDGGSYSNIRNRAT